MIINPYRVHPSYYSGRWISAVHYTALDWCVKAVGDTDDGKITWWTSVFFLCSWHPQELYPSILWYCQYIPMPDLKSIIFKLVRKSLPPSLECSELLNLINITLDQNYFRFNNSFFNQKTGLPVGSPLSPHLADIFLAELKNRMLSLSMFRNNIQFWYRYVDNVFCLWTSTLTTGYVFEWNKLSE